MKLTYIPESAYGYGDGYCQEIARIIVNRIVTKKFKETEFIFSNILIFYYIQNAILSGKIKFDDFEFWHNEKQIPITEDGYLKEWNWKSYDFEIIAKNTELEMEKKQNAL